MSRTPTASPEAVPAPEGLPPAPARFELVRLHRLIESPHNHRSKSWGEMDELVESIRAKGVLQPILARPCAPATPTGPDLEIVFGHRRFRATKRAGLEAIPAVIRELSDTEALEAAVVENLQRADVHPLEEAEGYEELLAQKDRHYTVEEIAAKVGKSKAYIYARLKLTALCPEARKTFYEGKLTASTALLVARIPGGELQKQALKELGRRGDGDPVSYREAMELVHRDYMLQLAKAPFKTADPELVPEAGPCTSCPHRTGNQRDLFADVRSADVCTNPPCYQAKTKAAGARKKAEAEAEGRTVITGKDAEKFFSRYSGELEIYGKGFLKPADRCYDDPKRRSYSALVGKAVTPTLVEAPDGRLHEILAAGAVAKALKEKGYTWAKAGSRPTSGSSPADRAAAKKDRERQAVEDEVEKRAALFLGAALDSKEPNRDVWDCAIHTLLAVMYGDADQVWVRRFGPDDPEKAFEKARPKMTANQLRAVFLDLHLSSEIGAFRSKVSERLFKWAGIDVKKIEAQVKADQKTADEEKTRPVVWTGAKGGGATGKAARGRVYTIRISATPLYPGRKGFSWSVNSSGEGAAGSGPFRTIEEAKRDAEKGEAERLRRASPAKKVSHG